MEAVDRVRSRLGQAAVLTDFDGTLAPIVDEPSASRPEPGALAALAALVDRAAVVGVVSGRPVGFLGVHLTDPRLHLAGLYGLERREDGVVFDDPEAERWLEPVARAATDLERLVPEGATVEAKRLSLTVHYRRHPDVAGDVLRAATSVAASHGLVTRPARKAVEVHPAGGPDKGSVVRELAAGCAAACFVGDDIGDLAAFTALDDLAEAGLDVVRVAVESEETPEELRDRADVLVDGTEGAVAWLAGLLAV